MSRRAAPSGGTGRGGAGLRAVRRPPSNHRRVPPSEAYSTGRQKLSSGRPAPRWKSARGAACLAGWRRCEGAAYSSPSDSGVSAGRGGRGLSEPPRPIPCHHCESRRLSGPTGRCLHATLGSLFQQPRNSCQIDTTYMELAADRPLLNGDGLTGGLPPAG